MICRRHRGCGRAPPKWPRRSNPNSRQTMNRRSFAASLLSLATTGCDLFKDKKVPLSGERIAVLGVGGGLEPDAKLGAAPVSLPPPELNRDWPEAGGNPAHAMNH